MYIAQQIAATAISQVFSGKNLTIALPTAQKQFINATPQQHGAAADLSYGTLRFYGQLSLYLDQLLEKPLSDSSVQSLLLVALYQLVHDKAGDFTVVNQAVKAAGYAKPKWAKGLVNGVLRNFLRQKNNLTQTFVQDEVAQFSYPVWWIKLIKQQYPQDWQAILVAGNQHPPMSLRVNEKKINMQEYRQLLHRKDIVHEWLGGEGLVLNKPLPVEKIPGFNEGIVSVQDYGAQFAAHLLDVHDNMHVLDACSAPGGKAGHILALADVDLTALDNDAGRLQRVQSNLTRLTLRAQLVLGDAAKQDWWNGVAFDRILADVPCSASGIVRRHVDIKWLRRESDILRFSATQTKILPSLWQMLAKGGKLLYVTCSVFKEENQLQIDQFLKNHLDAKQLPLNLSSKELYPNITELNGQLIPTTHHDGFFYALLQKN